MIYFVRAGETEMVKIGWTAESVDGRVRELQPGCWEKLRILRTVPGDRLVEAWFHQFFKGDCVAREWFRFNDQMMTVEAPDIGRYSGPHMAVIVGFGGVRPLAKAIGVAPNLATHWGQRGIPAKYWSRVQAVAPKHQLAITALELSKMSALLGTEAA